MSDDAERVKKKSLLLSYYGQNEKTSISGAGDSNGKYDFKLEFNSSNESSANLQQIRDPFDLNSTMFEPDKFLSKIIKVRILIYL